MREGNACRWGCEVYYGDIPCYNDWRKAYLFPAVCHCDGYGSNRNCMGNVSGLVQPCRDILYPVPERKMETVSVDLRI